MEAVDEVGVEYFDPYALEGTYSDKVSMRAMMDIVYNEAEGYYEVIISWGSSAYESTQWSMIAYDEGNTDLLTYEDCSCDNITYKDDGSFTAENVFSNKAGSLTVNEDMTISWIDDREGIKEEHIF